MTEEEFQQRFREELNKLSLVCGVNREGEFEVRIGERVEHWSYGLASVSDMVSGTFDRDELRRWLDGQIV